MKPGVVLTITSVLSIFFVACHIADDIARGLDRAGPWNYVAVFILGIWLCGALVLAERQSGYIILLLGSVFGLGIPYLHMKGARFPEIAHSDGGFFFVSTLFAMGATSFISLILSTRGLWSLRRGRR